MNGRDRVSTPAWHPPSDALAEHEGIWRPRSIAPVSYPAESAEVLFQIEDSSYWFRHRMNCIAATVRRHAPSGEIYDIGGGNGFVAAGLQKEGLDCVLLEPGLGVANARARGVTKVIQATLADAAFRPQSLPAVGLFDVLEHIENDVGFLSAIRERLVPGGRLYCTVPALAALWSPEDERAGHFRRYQRTHLAATFRRAGFTVEYVSYLFAWLVAPIFLQRRLLTRIDRRRRSQLGAAATAEAEHHLPRTLLPLVSAWHRWELARVRTGRALPTGSSLLLVARNA